MNKGIKRLTIILSLLLFTAVLFSCKKENNLKDMHTNDGDLKVETKEKETDNLSNNSDGIIEKDSQQEDEPATELTTEKTTEAATEIIPKPTKESKPEASEEKVVKETVAKETVAIETNTKDTATEETDAKDTSQPEPTESLIDPNSSEAFKVVVYKGKRLLELWQDSNIVGEYKIGLGFDPIGHKQIEGDGKTPEGSFYVCTRNNKSKFYLSLGLSYPGIGDAARGLESGIVTQKEHDEIVNAINSKSMPSWNTGLGGAIMIHGHGSQSDWTAGCVAVEDEIMDILWEHCKMGTEVIINP